MRMLALAVVLAGSQVSADTLETSRNQPITETAHTVAVTFDGGVATLVVQRTFANAGTDADQIGLELAVPAGAAATNLRIHARQRWYTGELLDAKIASERYRALTGFGAHEVKDPALLSWLDRGKLLLQVFPVMPKGKATVEYTLTVPMSYANGRYTFVYPSPAHVTAEGATIEDVADGVRIWTPAPTTTTTTYGRVVASAAHSIGRLDIDLAAHLSRPPVRAQVVFVVDASYSIGDRLQTELDIMRAYALELVDAEIEIVAYRRTAKRVFGALVAGRDFAARLGVAVAEGRFVLGNGSRLDEALALARTAISGRPGPKRIVVMTDELIPGSLTTPQVVTSLAALSPDTVVHVVVPGAGILARDDAAHLAPLALAHHGVLFRGAGVWGLVRPVAIDHLASSDLAVVDERHEEGSRIEVIAHAQALPERVVVTGQLWSDPIAFEATSTADTSRATAAFTIADEDTAELSRDEIKAVALAGDAVSPVTSYLAIEPGVRPSRRGFPNGVEGGVEGGVASGDCSCDVGAPPPPPPLRPDPAHEIDARACFAGTKAEAVRFELDTTRDEIVDVRLTGPRDDAADCVVEAAWRTHLDKRLYAAERDRFDVVVRRQ